MVWATVCVVVVVSSSCKTLSEATTKENYREAHHHDTLRIYHRDSIYVTQRQRGDTITVTQYVERWRTQEKVVERHDTVAVAQTRMITRYQAPRWCYWAVVMEGVAMLVATIIVLRRRKG